MEENVFLKPAFGLSGHALSKQRAEEQQSRNLALQASSAVGVLLRSEHLRTTKVEGIGFLSGTAPWLCALLTNSVSFGRKLEKSFLTIKLQRERSSGQRARVMPQDIRLHPVSSWCWRLAASTKCLLGREMLLRARRCIPSPGKGIWPKEAEL